MLAATVRRLGSRLTLKKAVDIGLEEGDMFCFVSDMEETKGEETTEEETKNEVTEEKETKDEENTADTKEEETEEMGTRERETNKDETKVRLSWYLPNNILHPQERFEQKGQYGSFTLSISHVIQADTGDYEIWAV